MAAFLLSGALALAAAGPAATAGADSAAGKPPLYVDSIRDLPGYVPLVDPESSAVVIGRRMNAALVRMPFTGGGSSMKALGEAICRVLEDTPKLDSLMMLAVGEDEFRRILWPEFPQSRPVTGLTADDGWGALYPRLLNGCNSALVEHAGGYYAFLRFEVDSVATYRNFTLHSGVTMVVRDATGAERRMDWLRAIAERKGRYKIYSVRD
jgi:hypothetical protein